MSEKWPQEMINKYGTLALQFVEENMELIEQNNFSSLFAKNTNIMMTSNIVRILYDSNIEWMIYVTTIPNGAFYALDHITELIIPDNITGIASNAFGNMGQLSKLVLPASIKNIGNQILKHTFYLNEIEFKGTKQQWADIWFGSHWNRDSHIGIVKCSDGTIRYC